MGFIKLWREVGILTAEKSNIFLSSQCGTPSQHKGVETTDKLQTMCSGRGHEWQIFENWNCLVTVFEYIGQLSP